MCGHVPGSPDAPPSQRGITLQTFRELLEDSVIAVGTTFLRADVAESCQEDFGFTGAYELKARRERSPEGAHMRRKRWAHCLILSSVLLLPPLMAEAKEEPALLEILSVSPRVISRGESIRITGSGFSKDAKGMTAEIDGKETGIVNVLSDNEIEVLINTDPPRKKGATPSGGEVERTVVVTLEGKKSQPDTFIQVTSWQVVSKPRVFVPTVLYVALVALLVVSVKGSVIRSATGQLSLSKTQMGLWTFVFGLSYVMLAAIYKDFLDITEGMFWLMGISSATAVGAKAIVIKNKMDPKAPNASRLLSDYDDKTQAYALSLHRCQIAIWTLIVMAMYVIELIETMRLPDIPNNLLVLMGISGSTYLGFNFPKPKQ